jgi:D-alanine-D-alanine ligase-like ATP-grasp enzyme
MKKDFCPECGPAEVTHIFTKTNLTIDMISKVVFAPIKPLISFCSIRFSRQLEYILYFLFNFLAILKIVSLASKPSKEHDTDRAKTMWQAGEERGVKIWQVWVLGKPINIFLAKLESGRKMVFEGLPRPGGDSKALEWMDDKGVMKIKFKEAGFPVPRGRVCFTKKCALKTFEEIRKNGGMVVAKPTLGSRSRHTKVHIKTREELIKSFKIAKQICPIVSIEEELKGWVYRVSLIGGEVAGVLRRDPPYVIGDGKKTVKELILEANKDPRRESGAFHEIPINDELDSALKIQSLDRDSVPVFGKKIIAGVKVGRSQGGTNADVTDEIHIENKKLFTDIGRFLDDPLVGIDFIIEDISRPWRAQMPCGVIELNTVPFLDLHLYPFLGKERNLMNILWDEVLLKEK